MRGTHTAWLSLTMLLCSTGVAAAQQGPLDYPQWRGVNRDGAAAAFAEPDTWPSQLTQQWQVETGRGYATPILVGDRIGLHPVAVIFAVMAGGQLFGFFGVLLALPVAAVIVVLLRHSRDEYLQSELYGR